MLEVTHRTVVVLQAGVVIETLGKYSLAKIGLQSNSGFGRLPCFFTEGDGRLKTLCKITTRVDIREQRPTKGELRIQPHRFFHVFLRAKGVRRCECSL